jgi:hypothetical protein
MDSLKEGGSIDPMQSVEAAMNKEEVESPMPESNEETRLQNKRLGSLNWNREEYALICRVLNSF